MIFNKKNDCKISFKADAEIEILNILSQHIQSHSVFKNHVYLVGGLVRDFLLNLPIKDIDLVVDFPRGAQKFCEDLHQSFPDITSTPHELGRGYPIWHVMIKKIGVDIAETQKECFPDSQSRQRLTTFGTFAEDILRRDFTINMLAYDFTTDQILDPCGCGLKDLKAGLIQTHPELNPDKVFSDDPLRMLRAVRFACKFNFKISENTKASITKNSERLKIVSSERILSELEKIVTAGQFPKALGLLNELGLFPFVFKNLEFDRMNLSHNLKKIQKAPQTLKAQFAFLGINQNLEHFTEFLQFLKLDNQTRQSLLKTVAGLKELTQPLVPWTDLHKRAWARKYHAVLENIFAVEPDLKTDFAQALKVPIRLKPLIDVDALKKTYQLQGEQIQKVLSKALELEDRWILENQKEIPAQLSWQLLADFIKTSPTVNE